MLGSCTPSLANPFSTLLTLRAFRPHYEVKPGLCSRRPCLCTAVKISAPVLHKDILEVLFTEAEIKLRVEDMGRCCVLNGYLSKVPTWLLLPNVATHVVMGCPSCQARALASDYEHKEPLIIGVHASLSIHNLVDLLWQCLDDGQDLLGCMHADPQRRLCVHGGSCEGDAPCARRDAAGLSESFVIRGCIHQRRGRRLVGHGGQNTCGRPTHHRGRGHCGHREDAAGERGQASLVLNMSLLPWHALFQLLAYPAQEVCARLLAQGAATVATVTLLDKAARRTVDLQPDYRGFEVRRILREFLEALPRLTSSMHVQHSIFKYLHSTCGGVRSARMSLWWAMAWTSMSTTGPSRTSES